jgi:hypothetical protein
MLGLTCYGNHVCCIAAHLTHPSVPTGLLIFTMFDPALGPTLQYLHYSTAIETFDTYTSADNAVFSEFSFLPTISYGVRNQDIWELVRFADSSFVSHGAYSVTYTVAEDVTSISIDGIVTPAPGRNDVIVTIFVQTEDLGSLQAAQFRPDSDGTQSCGFANLAAVKSRL